MKHCNKNNHLGRISSHRKSMLMNMSNSLIIKKQIITTLSKAKSLKKYIEPIITKSKNNNIQSKRMVFRYLKNKKTVSILFKKNFDILRKRMGGYTRIIKISPRLGDYSKMALIELIGFNKINNNNNNNNK
ncbi:50S ribosomal protein L17 [Candidatus Shikimatogenerans silvanidophilus]|uniref:50S ribosomal protein L17 n=1 Tax=Candidatus Shikimatogenerans silvanidophilus TaxID=2782547 RepID=UPI001BA7F19D|nr:50S ribosomal protein L17 [Candidatus Shikimatogenerans silvanidophilus]